jgi:hypothetical protein
LFVESAQLAELVGVELVEHAAARLGQLAVGLRVRVAGDARAREILGRC